MTTAEQRRQWIEALHEYRDDSERLFALVASLANVLDKALVIETMEAVLGVTAVHDGDCIILDDLGIRYVNVGLPGAGPHVVEVVTRLVEEIRDSRLDLARTGSEP